MANTKAKYYYELQRPTSAVWTPKNCARMTEAKLIKDASFRLSDYFIESAKADQLMFIINLVKPYLA